MQQPAGAPPHYRSEPQTPPVPPIGEQPMPPSPDGSAPVKARPLPLRFILPVVLLVLVVGGYVGYGYWLEQTYYVSTENAQVAGTMIQVGSLSAGRLMAVYADLGQRVAQDQVVATLALPSTQSITPAGPRLGFAGTDDQMVEVRSPVDGVVVARLGNPGDTIVAGQPIVTVVDPRNLWINANVEETKVGRLAIGQPVEVYVDSLGKTLPGRVAAITPATAAVFSLLPQQNASGNFNKVVQLVAVRIAVQYDHEEDPLLLGSSVRVRIRVR